jgi:chromosome partitioning protein
MIFVINGAAHRARITADAAIALSQHGAVSPTIIYQRTDYASSMIDGRTAGELDSSSKSAIEILDLWTYVNAHFSKKGNKRK